MIYLYRFLFVLLLLFPFSSSVSAPDDLKEQTMLPDSVARILAAHKIPVDSLSIFVQEIGKDTPLLAVNSDVPRNPASTIKLLTTYMALEDLGPDYRWKTEAYLGGKLNDGLLDGDLYLKGYGDPYMVVERFWLFLRQMRQRGLLNIAGDLAIDNTYFDVPDTDPGAFDGQAFRTYNVAPDAFLVNFQAINFIFRPDPMANRVEVIAEPKPTNLEIRNQVQLANKSCGGFQLGITVRIADIPAQNQVTFAGRFGSACSDYYLSRSVLQAPSYAYGVFSSLWQEMGAKIQGGVRLEQVPEDLDPFLTVESPPLSEVVRSVNKWSNNVMARHIFLTMGAERFGAPATVDKGREAAYMYLAEDGLDFPELRLDNGAGLSRDTRISARSLGRVLLAADDSLYRAEFVSSLPLSGLDGTLRSRFRNEGLTGRMHLKTGRLTDVFAMAGYLRDKSNNQYVVVAIQNYDNAHRGPGEEVQSALLRWVYQQ
jgi:D-alanyl-D-alanine carboxypeptidase/D-alanyl-D-alanine-endopeptidase (penicillin-binding protein 4)